LPQVLFVRFYYSILSNLGGIPFGVTIFGEGLALVVLASSLFSEAYLVHTSIGFADFITHFTMPIWIKFDWNLVSQR
jgi:hypothetical protein